VRNVSGEAIIEPRPHTIGPITLRLELGRWYLGTSPEDARRDSGKRAAAPFLRQAGRVIEIPTPRWTAYDAKRFGVKPLEGTRMTVTERAYTSPIWYTPAK
jgi:Protein of unknown function (DUF3604)